MTLRYREGSRCQQMWALWETKGTATATAFGPSLELAPSTIKNWCRTWDLEKERGGPKPKEARQPKERTREARQPKEGRPAKLPRVPKIAKLKPVGKRRVTCSYMPGRVGYLMHEGPEVSEVLWDDEFGEIFIINRFLKDASKKQEEVSAKKLEQAAKAEEAAKVAAKATKKKAA